MTSTEARAVLLVHVIELRDEIEVLAGVLETPGTRDIRNRCRKELRRLTEVKAAIERLMLDERTAQLWFTAGYLTRGSDTVNLVIRTPAEAYEAYAQLERLKAAGSPT